jgi:hypothetical protein
LLIYSNGPDVTKYLSRKVINIAANEANSLICINKQLAYNLAMEDYWVQYQLNH